MLYSDTIIYGHVELPHPLSERCQKGATLGATHIEFLPLMSRSCGCLAVALTTLATTTCTPSYEPSVALAVDREAPVYRNA